ncbi:MAG: hypothetical protein CBD98_000985 [Flavobacteriaceae bacterium TMED238]|nr:MAG: hypothetical protein CBD98_000985 [Flavobacteriaceae bacterium TMED238]|tara:strand:- start:525 stop:917 length:393 start_codon:yes stop_codon:yes gene_type:complete
MKLKKTTYATLFLLVFFTLYQSNFYKKTTPDLSIKVECPKKIIENKDLPIYIDAYTETDYIENIDISLLVDGLSIDILSFSRSDFSLDRKFQNTVLLRFSESQINQESKVFIFFTLRDKYGNIAKTNCEY